MMQQSQHSTQHQQQCPPPPSTSPRYLLAIPKSVTNIDSLGISFVPRHVSCSDPSRSIGAKISGLPYKEQDDVHTTGNKPLIAWIKQYKMRVGDVLFKVNDEIVRTKSHEFIMDRLTTLLKAQCELEGPCNEKSSEGITLILERGEQKHQMEEGSKIGGSSLSHHKAPQDVGNACKLSLSMDLSREHNVLQCIFSHANSRQRLNEDDETNSSSDQIMDSISCSTSESSQLMFPFGENSNTSNYRAKENKPIVEDVGDEDFSTTHNSIGYDLSAIPEGAESEISRESDAYVVESAKAQHQHSSLHDRDLQIHVPAMQPKLPTTIYQSQQNSIISNEFSRSMDSPSFSYSDSECVSPVGDRISNDAADSSRNDFNHGDVARTNAINGMHYSLQTSTSCVNRNKMKNTSFIEPRSTYFSPESDQPTQASKCDYTHRSNNSLSRTITNHSHRHMSNILTPLNHVKSKASYFQSPVSEIHPTSSLESCSVSTVYLSPLSNLPISSSSKNATGMSAGSSLKERSRSSYSCYRDIPIHMLDYNYVRSCKSEVELKKIVEALSVSTDGESQQFPSLLRLAKGKLREIAFTYSHTCDRSTEGMKVDINPLNKSLNQAGDIPSHIHVEIQNSLGENKGRPKGVCGSKNLSIASKNDDSELVENMNSIVIAHAELQDRMETILDERETVQVQLKNEIIILEEKLHNVGLEYERQKCESMQKIQILEEAKIKAEGESQKLRDTVVSSSKEAKRVVDSLEMMQKEVRDLQSMLDAVQESKRQELEEAKSIQNRLENQVTNLCRQVELHEKDDKVTRELLELELRSEYHAISQIERARINELERCLLHTREELNRMYRENDALTVEFAKVGKNPTTPSQFREILKEFAAAESCANALAKALTESESELASVSMENRRLKRKHQKLHRKNKELAAENEELLLILDAIDEKLEKSHDVIDHLHKELDKHQSRQNDCNVLRSKWNDAKKVYQSKIDELKLQLTNAEEMVPATKYQQALDSAEALRNTVKDKEVEIKELSDRVKALELKIEASSKVPERSKVPKSVVNKEVRETFPPSTKLSHQPSPKVLSPLIDSNAEEPWQDVFSPTSCKTSITKLKNRRESNKKEVKSGIKKRLALTPIQDNHLDTMKTLNMCTGGKENMYGIQVL